MNEGVGIVVRAETLRSFGGYSGVGKEELANVCPHSFSSRYKHAQIRINSMDLCSTFHNVFVYISNTKLSSDIRRSSGIPHNVLNTSDH